MPARSAAATMARSAAIAVATVLAACIPPDDSAPRFGSFAFDVQASEATLKGLTTDDGWAITFDRVVTVPVNLSVSGRPFNDGPPQSGDNAQPALPPGCEPLDSWTSDTFSFGTAAVDPRVGWTETWNRLEKGKCVVAFAAVSYSRTFGTWTEVRPGPGASDRDVEDLQRDQFVAVLEGSAVRLGGVVPGRASTLRFAVGLRSGGAPASRMECTPAEDMQRVKVGERLHIAVIFRAERIFADALRSDGALRFEPWADADRAGDGNGVLTTEELNAVPLAQVCAADGRYRGYPAPISPDEQGQPSLLNFVQAQLYEVWEVERCPRITEVSSRPRPDVCR